MTGPGPCACGHKAVEEFISVNLEGPETIPMVRCVKCDRRDTLEAWEAGARARSIIAGPAVTPADPLLAAMLKLQAAAELRKAAKTLAQLADTLDPPEPR